LDEQVLQLKALYQPRLDAMLEALDQNISEFATWYRPEGGFFIGMTLKNEISQEILLQKSQEAGLLLTDGRGFFVEPNKKIFVRLPFCALSPEDIQEGISRLAKVVKALSTEQPN
jgi:2-aminoadipate transaminase